ncbi:MAG: translocation/assembly module TamB domain-containing protein [Candidatus Margulisbacteria bacterium]|jgi:hypothetical protein|nr:translocation/assembly module TamB domain-containing protein [Candidatus Margulisiibacteriota bacterium]
MRRFLPCFSLLLLIFLVTPCAWGFSVKEWSASLYSSVRQEAEKSFSALLGKPVTIERAGGVLVGQIDLYGVTFPGLGRAEKVILTYNPLEYALNKGDMVKALTKITVDQATVRIERDRRGRWNVLSLLAPDSKQESGPPPFRGWLVLQACRVDYSDEIGFRPNAPRFAVRAEDVNGRVNLRRLDKITFSLTGALPEKVIASGSFDQPSGRFDLQVTAEKLPADPWVNYTVPLPDLVARHGQVDVLLQLAPAKTPGWPVALTGKFTLHDAAAGYQQVSASGINGELFLVDDSLSFRNVRGRVNDLQVTVNGRLFDFAALKLDSQVIVHQGKIYDQAVRGTFAANLRKNLLQLTTSDLGLYGGRATVRAALDLAGAQPRLELDGKFSGLNLALLARSAPGVEGTATGTLDLRGPLNALRGQVNAKLNKGLVLGQPMDSLDATFRLKDNNFLLDQCGARGGNALFIANGELTRDFRFKLNAEAAGLRLAGRGPAGRMGATLNSFRGSLGGRLDQFFLATPLKHLTADGQVELVGGFVGEQTFDRAAGKLSIGGGRISISDAAISNGSSAVAVDGVTGIGCPTDLKIAGPLVDLEELKILNLFLPEELRDPIGLVSFEAALTGALSAETELTALDPLLDLNLVSRVTLRDGRIAEVPIDYAEASFSWQARALTVADTCLYLPDSSLELNLTLSRNGQIRGLLTGVTDLALLQRLTTNYGRLSGLAGFSLLLTGEAAAPAGSAAFWLQEFSLNDLHLDRVEGSVAWHNDRLIVLRPISLTLGADRYSFTGDFSAAGLTVDFRVVQADLGSAFNLYQKGQAEFFRRFSPPAQHGRAVIDLAGFQLPQLSAFADNGTFRLYQGEQPKYFLQRFAQVRKDFERQLAKSPAETLGGTLTGEVKLAGVLPHLTGEVRAAVDRGELRAYRFDDLQFVGRLQPGKFKIDRAVLHKNGGELTIRGDYDLADTLFLHLIANNLPVDLLELIFPGKKYRGNFNMNAGIDGPISAPRFTLAAAGRGISLAGADFDEVTISATKRGPYFYLHELSLLQEGRLSKAYGSVALTTPGKIALEADLQGNALGLLNLFTDQVEWRQGDSTVKLKMTGSLLDPQISGRATVTQGRLFVRALDSELHDLQGSASIESNLLSIHSLTGIWQGKRTREVANPLGLAGTIDLSRALNETGELDLDLRFSPTRVYAAFPNLYVGALGIERLSLTGPLRFDLSQGPQLTGKLAVADAVITLTQDGSGGRPFPLDLDLTVDLNKNVYAAMGDVTTLNLSNILMNLEIAGTGLKISGSLAQPVMLGQIDVKRGTVNIFNREFNLLNLEQQKRYYPYDADKVQANRALFKGRESVAGIMPELNIAASVIVDNTTRDAEGKSVNKPINIVAKLTGTIGAREESQALKIGLAAFNEDKTKSPPEMVPVNYNEQDLKVMLLPDFIKSLAGIGRPEQVNQEKSDTNAIVADYLSSRVQSLLFRGLEREVESKLGLESLTLEYNFGPRFREAMGIRDIKGFESEKPAWSVGFVKGFFDRLYVDVRYSQAMEQTSSSASEGSAAATSFNYQLTYKLTPIWSIIYYREPLSMQQVSTGYSKLTLKAGFSFW